MSRPSMIGLLWRQVQYQLLMFWRTPVALFFTLLLPLIMLVLFNALFGDETITTNGGQWSIQQFYTGGLAAFAAVSATYTNLANMVPIRREEGVLKRWRSTPLPTGVYIAGFILSSLVLALIGTVIMLGMGALFYELEIDAAKLPALLVSFVVGICAFAALGMAVAALVPTAASASAVANATILPLAFVSNIFIISDDNAPSWMTTIGNIFPLRPFAESIQDAFNPFVDAPGFSWEKIGWVALWGLAGLVVAVRYFRWEPRPGGSTRRRRSRATTA